MHNQRLMNLRRFFPSILPSSIIMNVLMHKDCVLVNFFRALNNTWEECAMWDLCVAACTCWRGEAQKAQGRQSQWAGSGHRGEAQRIQATVQPSSASPPWSRLALCRTSGSAETQIDPLAPQHWTTERERDEYATQITINHFYVIPMDGEPTDAWHPL